jgi:hypothetical protein
MTKRSPAEAIFFAALELATAADRAAFLEEACAGDQALRRRVERLLAAHPQVGGFLERPVAEAADLAGLTVGKLSALPLGNLLASVSVNGITLTVKVPGIFSVVAPPARRPEFFAIR